MKISVIIPVYNSERTIIRALDSVLSQSIGTSLFEVIIINDGSTDNSLKLIESYKKINPQLNIKIIDKENGGVSSARNAGLLVASGDYIALLDSDDEWIPNKIETQLNFFKTHPNAKFVGTNVDGRKARLGFKIIKEPSILKIKDILITMNPQTSSALISRDVLEDVGFYNENLTHAEDGDLWYRIFSKYESWFLPQQLVVFDRGKRGFGENGLSGNLKKMQAGIRRLNKLAYINNSINLFQYLFISIYNELKYVRRRIINLV